jgi:hypothetical protein
MVYGNVRIRYAFQKFIEKFALARFFSSPAVKVAAPAEE